LLLLAAVAVVQIWAVVAVLVAIVLQQIFHSQKERFIRLPLVVEEQVLIVIQLLVEMELIQFLVQ
jgi:hypothetical protein